MKTFDEKEFHARILKTDAEKLIAYNLRHKVFAEEFGWVSTRKENIEIDYYDDTSTLLGIFHESRLVGCLRVTLSSEQFMLEKEFSDILSGYTLQKNAKTIEVTRFCLAPDVRNYRISTEYGVFPIVMLLEKTFYTWCRNSGVDDVYMVVSKHFFRLLNLLGMPCEAIAPEVRMPDGIIAIAAKSSWSAFERENVEKRPELLGWFRNWEKEFINQMAA